MVRARVSSAADTGGRRSGFGSGPKKKGGGEGESVLPASFSSYHEMHRVAPGADDGMTSFTLSRLCNEKARGSLINGQSTQSLGMALEGLLLLGMVSCRAYTCNVNSQGGTENTFL